VLGHIYPELSDDQLEAIGMVDVLFTPVGGHGYTLDAVGALRLTRVIDPKLVIPTHYEDKALKYEVPQTSLAQAVTELSMEPKEKLDKLKVKSTDLGEVTQLVVLQKS
jgi:L-ascorbate metabolism protein UlaG (beta-lactamase superfamily)